jgi:CDP-diacylglycerol--serine O-phosphatidyltransferase
MVSTWRFWSGKEINFSRSHPFQVLVLVAIVMYVLIRYSNVVMFGIGLTYMFSGIGARAAYGWSRRRRRRPIETSAALQDAPQEEEAEKRDPPQFQ